MSAQISAYISDETKDRFESYSKVHGLKKAFLVENALNYYLSALEEIPSQFFDEKKIELIDESFDEVLSSQNNEPTPELIQLMRND